MSFKPIVSVVIGSFNRLEFLKSTVDTVRKDIEGLQSEMIVIDGGSTDGTIDWLVKQKDIITILQHNRGEWQGNPIERKSWGYFMNLGFRAANGKYICMLSDDCLVIPGAIPKALKLAERKREENVNIGMVAFYWRNWPEQEKYWVGLAWGNRMFVNHGLYLREALESVNFIDQDNYFFYHADGDLALRIWDAGYQCIDGSESYIEHYSDANTEVRASNQGRQKLDWSVYEKRWKHLKMPSKDWIEISYQDETGTADKYWNSKPTTKNFWRRIKK